MDCRFGVENLSKENKGRMSPWEPKQKDQNSQQKLERLCDFRFSVCGLRSVVCASQNVARQISILDDVRQLFLHVVCVYDHLFLFQIRSIEGDVFQKSFHDRV